MNGSINIIVILCVIVVILLLLLISLYDKKKLNKLKCKKQKIRSQNMQLIEPMLSRSVTRIPIPISTTIVINELEPRAAKITAKSNLKKIQY
jgi:hypothetical protein